MLLAEITNIELLAAKSRSIIEKLFEGNAEAMNAAVSEKLSFGVS